jgi:hypothetical protein
MAADDEVSRRPVLQRYEGDHPIASDLPHHRKDPFRDRERSGNRVEPLCLDAELPEAG